MLRYIDGREFIIHDGHTTKVSRLTAVAEYGFDAVVDRDVHHLDEEPLNNSPSNLIPMSHGEHTRLHSAQVEDRKVGIEPRTVGEHVQLREAYTGEPVDVCKEAL